MAHRIVSTVGTTMFEYSASVSKGLLSTVFNQYSHLLLVLSNMKSYTLRVSGNIWLTFRGLPVAKTMSSSGMSLLMTRRSVALKAALPLASVFPPTDHTTENKKRL